MPISQYQQRKLHDLKKRAVELYKQGLTVREVAAVVKKSPAWVSISVRQIENEKADTDG